MSSQLLRMVFSFYFLVAFVVTVGHMLVEYANAKKAIIEDLSVYNHTFNSAIAISAWNMDRNQLISTLKGILALPTIAGVRFSPAGETEEELTLGEVSNDSHSGSEDQLLTDLHKELFSRSFPVIYRTAEGKDFGSIGTLTLFSRRTIVIKKIQHSLLIILINAIVKTMSLYFFFMLALKKVVARPLAEMTGSLNSLDLNGPMNGLKLVAKKNSSSELTIMTDAYNKMISRIVEYTTENKKLHFDLHELNQDLEKRVRVRTKQLQDAQRKLLKAAHVAGMSQVTTEILHNVGNIANSVVVSVHSMKDSIYQDDFDKFLEVLNVLAKKVRSGDFAGLDEILEYITVFGSKSRRDMEGLKQVLDNLQKFVVHLRHISEIQKSALQDVNFENEILIDLLIDDSLQLSGLKGDGRIEVKVHKSQEDIPVFLSDEHKLIQVLVNLLVNAKHAVIDNKKPSKYVHIHLEVVDRHLRIAIEDNGVGISLENMTKVFQSGFTTKSQGSGLGLHNSANNIKSVGGDIEFYSPGEMAGATFVVRVPLKKVKKVG